MKKFYLILLLLLSACANSYKGDELIDLKGKKEAQVIKILGKPISERKEGKFTKMWAYCQQGCSTLVFFDNQGIVQYAERRGNCTLDKGEK